MESGAHYHRCDFQVHTPRDINWDGDRPGTEEDRKHYAEAFIAACRKMGLHAVAITDHHDIAFYSYIKEAAHNELDENGDPVPEKDRIIAFPGMELTLGVPCQALLLLDSNFSVDLLSQLPTILAVTQNPRSEPKHAEVVRLNNIRSIGDLCDLLDARDFLKCRYIILPNVSENGDFSILRKGFAPHYKDMPCVGGYVDGPVDKLGTGNKKILAGGAKEYGFKKLAVFQTSDNRRANFENLGRYTTWVKWATPTAEALRQASLAQETRISHTEPQLPAIVIYDVEVSNSKFLGPFAITFNPQFNALIGGRGTGKSTILEYLRWALCDQPPAFSEEDEIPDFQKKRAGLIENTLAAFDASVTVTFILNGIPHVVRRNAKTKQAMLKVGAGEFEERAEQTIRDLLPIQAYSQKQLSTVGVRTDELVRFVKTPMTKRLRDFHVTQEEIKRKLRTNYLNMKARRALAREIDRERLEITSLNQQVQQLRNGLKGLSEDDQKILAQHDSILAEEQLVRSYVQAIGDWRHQIDLLAAEITMPDDSDDTPSETPHAQKIRDLRSELDGLYRGVFKTMEALRRTLAEDAQAVQRLRLLESHLQDSFRVHNEQYEGAKARSTAHQGKLKQISEAEQRARTLREGIAAKERQLVRYGKPEEQYQQARNEWNAVHATRADALEARCSELTKLSAGRIRARLRRGAGVDAVKDRLSSLITGTRLRAKKVDDLCYQLSADPNPISRWDQTLTELETLASIDAADESQIEVLPCTELKKAGFAPSDLEKVARRITAEDWLELSLIELTDIPVFEYQQREGDYIDFSVASAGQQATALLRVLLAQEGPPLVIDQPEEDLDNPIILEIVHDIWKAKTKRQIMFSSHNANIVVNGDADLVICCDYRTIGDQSGGQIKARGAIDMDLIRNEITTVMEGGKEAFRLRKEKYGF